MPDIQLTDEQLFFLDRAASGANILVDACIGSGKTTTIQKACDAMPSKKILYLTYNRRLYDDACRKILNSNTTVATFHRFAAICCAGNGIKDTDKYTVCRVFSSRVTHIQKYDIVIVDEYQDLRDDTAGVLNTICRLSWQEYNGFVPQFLIVGDMEQKISDTSSFRADEFVKQLFDKIGNAEYMRFTRCFRLAPSYAADIGQAWGKSIIGCNPSCSVEVLHSLRQCVQIMGTYEPRDVLVLGGQMSWGARTQLQNMVSDIYPDEYNKDTVYASTRDQDEMVSFDTSDAAIFTTFDSAKGLERRLCIVCDFTASYLEAREKYSLPRQILKNLFLVAASRGKERIIFYQSDRDDILSMDDVGMITGGTPVDMRPVAMSTAFEHKYDEDIHECMDFISVEQMSPEGQVIKATKSDGFIDLSACIGIHAQATYFKNFNIDAMVAHDMTDAMNRMVKLPEYKDTWSLQKKILYYMTMSTGQVRYLTDIRRKFVSKASNGQLCDRLSSVFDGSEPVEVPCAITFSNVKISGTGMTVGDKVLSGRCDAFTHAGELYELKFVDSVTPDHKLQAALYAIAFGCDHTVLWNLQDDSRYRVSVDSSRISGFLQAICRCISKDMLEVSPGSIHITG